MGYRQINTEQSFGDWLRQHRRALDLTQEELAGQVGCSAITLRKLEAEERRPSKQIAERLAEVLNIAPDDRPAFLRFARGDPFAAPGDGQARDKPEPTKAPAHGNTRFPHGCNLPLQLTSFVGREKEIAEVKRLISAGRLVTLTGAGGTGKTRLALQVAAGQLDHFLDGVWLIELAPLADPALVPQTVAAVLGLRETPGRTITTVLRDDLGPKRALLVLDNCEHLIAACAELAELLLRACPHLTILATSREGLGIAGESAYQVPSLSLPYPNQLNSIDVVAQSEAVRLFVERAVVVLGRFRLTRENLSAVIQVCQQLDGIPLAIELAVARLRMLPVAQIAARLAERDPFRLLTGGNRTALPRHQTLQALIDWSYELLTAPEQVLLRRLAVFAGGWTLEAAEAVCPGDGVSAGEEFDLLGHLIDKSLVQVDMLAASGVAWYHLLETIRQYALAKLAASGEADALRRQHAAYYLTLWEENRVGLNTMPQRAWFDRAEMELDNLRAALTWSQSPLGNAELGLRLSGAVSYSLFGYTESRAWLEGALAHADAERTDFPQARAVALGTLGEVAVQLGDYETAQAPLTQSLMLFQALGDTLSSACVLERLGLLAREQGDAATARVRLAESLALYRDLGDKVGVAGTLNTLGEVAVMQADIAEAVGLLNEGLTLNRELAYTNGIGWSLNHLGHVAQLQGEYERAMRLHEESLLMFQKVHPQYHGVGEANQCLGETALAQGDATLATRHFREALDLFRFSGARAHLAWCLTGLAGVAVLDEDPKRAALLWGAAEALRTSIGARAAPASRATHERLMATTREQLSEAAFDAAWAEGQRMTMEQGIELALDQGD